MKIVIPMSGFGERFKKAGYMIPKPLIKLEGKPMIQHVREMFPGDHGFIFICNQEHLDSPQFQLRDTLRALSNQAEIVGIPSHKLGPVYAVSQVFKHIQDDEPVIVNYCDFTCYWNFADFCAFVSESDSDACLPCYKGFHPHMLGTTNYAFLREEGLWATDIKEKEPFTCDRMSEFASSGTFYFATGKLLKAYLKRCIDQKILVNGEYYVSMAMKPMMDDGLRVSIYELQHFMQWGTPEDVREYEVWSKLFKDLLKPQDRSNKINGTLLLPMAGLGNRFAKEGYSLPKPLIPVSGKRMVIQASLDLPQMTKQIFVLRKDLPGVNHIVDTLEESFPGSKKVLLDHVTDGQARTCLLGLEDVALNEPLMIGACDNGVIYNQNTFLELMEDESVDIIIWTVRGYPGAVKNPTGYGWIELQKEKVAKVSVKIPLGQPAHDPIIIGAFTFKRAKDFIDAANQLIENDTRVNGEFYIDSLINNAIQLGKKVSTIEIDDYLCWGTPNDLKTFEYWQSCFSKWFSHPYSLEADSRVPFDAKQHLSKIYEWQKPKRPYSQKTKEILNTL